MDWAWGHSVWGFVAMAIFWAAVIALVVIAVRSWGGSERRPPDPREILAERLARGEISEEEFEARRRVLESHQAKEDA